MEENNQQSQGEDVNQATEVVETDTTSDSSNAEQTATESKESSSAEDTKGTDEQSVPYSRFREVNEKAKRVEELEARLAEFESRATANDPEIAQKEVIKQQLDPILKEMGYVSKAELKRQEEDKLVQDQLSQLEKTYNGSDGRPKFNRDEVINFALDKQVGDLETAYKMRYEKELIDWHVQQAITKSGGIKTETSDGSGSQGVGSSDDDLKEAIGKGDKTALRTYLKRVAKGSK